MLIALALADEQQVPLLLADAEPAGEPATRTSVRMCRVNLIETSMKASTLRRCSHRPLAGTDSASISSRMNSAASWAF